MSRTFKICFCFLLVLMAIGINLVTIGYQKQKDSNQNLVLSDDYDNNTLNTVTNNNKLTTSEVIIIICSTTCLVLSLSVLLSSFFHIDIIGIKKNFIIYILCILLITGCLSLIVIVSGNRYLNNNSSKIHSDSYQSSIIMPHGKIEIKENQSLVNESYFSNTGDQNVILVKGKTSADLDNIIIRQRGNTNNIVGSKIYGINASVLVLNDATLNLKNSNIETSAEGGIGVFSALNNSIINLQNTSITTGRNSSSGLAASFGGNIVAHNMVIKTGAEDSSSLYAIRDGVITVNNSILETNGMMSPIIYSSSDITVNSCNGDANASYLMLIEDTGKIKINNSNFEATGNKINDNPDTGILIKHNLLKNDYDKQATLSINNSKLEIKEQSRVYHTAPMFSIIDNNASIDITDSELLFGSNTLMNIMSNQKDSVHVTFNVKNQTLDGKISTDKKSSLEFNLVNSRYTGAINHNNHMYKITLNLDKYSSFSLTDDTYVTVLSDADKSYKNIKTNGHHLYYVKEQNPQLNGQTIIFDDGGKIEGI